MEIITRRTTFLRPDGIPRFRNCASRPRRVLKKKRVKGIEPSYVAWEATVLPLNYTRDRTQIVDFTTVHCKSGNGDAELHPFLHLLRERTLRTVGTVLNAKIFVDLQ